MSIILKLSEILSIILLSCTLICGLWVRYHKQEDMQFHFMLSLISVIVSLLTIILFMFQK